MTEPNNFEEMISRHLNIRALEITRSQEDTLQSQESDEAENSQEFPQNSPEAKHYSKSGTHPSEVFDEESVRICDSFVEAVGKYAVQGVEIPSSVVIAGPEIPAYYQKVPKRSYSNKSVYQPVSREPNLIKGYAIGYSTHMHTGGRPEKDVDDTSRDVFLCDDGLLRTRNRLWTNKQKPSGEKILKGETSTNLPFDYGTGKALTPITDIAYKKIASGTTVEYHETGVPGHDMPYDKETVNLYVVLAYPTSLTKTLNMHIRTLSGERPEA